MNRENAGAHSFFQVAHNKRTGAYAPCRYDGAFRLVMPLGVDLVVGDRLEIGREYRIVADFKGDPFREVLAVTLRAC